MNVNGVTSSQATNAYQSYSNTTSTAKYSTDTELVEKLKSDAEMRTENFQNMVRELFSKQVNLFGQSESIWRFLASNEYTVDAATKTQATEAISENGYYGVEQTSDRIIAFANALTGGDPSKIESMKEAFEKGYKQAEKTWGGTLPDICKQTFDAVLTKFDKLAEDANSMA